MLQITAVGNLASDPRTTTIGDSEVTNFTILCNKKIKGEDVTTAIDCSVWGKRAPVAANYLFTGSQVTVTGEGHLEVFERKNGQPGAKIALRVNDFALPPKGGQVETPF
jgi:single-strand DNA-binding protein